VLFQLIKAPSNLKVCFLNLF